MTADAAARLAQTELAHQRFMDAYLAERNHDAAEIFLKAAAADPDGAFRYFASHSAGQLSQALARSQRVDEAISQLDPLIADHPHMNLICPSEPQVIERAIAKREENIEKGLPSVVLAAMGKSASTSVGNIFHSGFELPTFAHSLLHLQVIPSWARDFARGGACYTTHLDPTREAVARLKQAGISRIIVHVRDPRQTLVSIVHHFDRYPDQLVNLREQAKDAPNLSARAMSVLSLYSAAIRWIRGWLDLEGEIDILFSTFEEFVTDRPAFVEKYLEFYGVDRNHFSWDHAFGEHTGVDNHFREGRIDEWREVFSREEAEYLTSMLPLRAKERFGWWDPDEQRPPAAHAASAPTHCDRVLTWLRQASEPEDLDARREVDRLVAAGAKLPADLEERALRSSLLDHPDHAGMLMRMWRLIANRGAPLPDGLAIHALRSRLADLSRSGDAEPDDRIEIERELAVLEILEQVGDDGSVQQVLLQGSIKVPDAQGYAKLGRELTRRHDFGGAEVAYLLAIELDPRSRALYRSLADVIDANGRSREAVEILQPLAAQAPHDAELQARLGHLLIRAGDLGAAEAVLRRAITLDQVPLEARCDLADVLAATGRASEGAAMLQALVAQGIGDQRLHARLKQLLQRHPAAAAA